MLFLVLSLVLIPRLGPLGAAIALVSSDIIAQSGVLFVIIAGETLRHPIRHALLLIAMMAAIVVGRRSRGRRDQIFVAGIRNPAFPDGMHALAGSLGLLVSPLREQGSFVDRLIAAMPRVTCQDSKLAWRMRYCP